MSLLTPIEAADFLGVSKGTLAVWRCQRRYNIPYVKVGRSVRYEESDLRKWMESRTVRSNAEMEARAREPFYDIAKNWKEPVAAA